MISEICVIATHQELADKVKKVVDESGEDIAIFTALMDDAVVLGKELIQQGAKVFISRGGNAMYLEKNLDIPVVYINHTISDYFEALEQAKSVKGRIGIFNYVKKLDDIDTIGKLMNLDIVHYVFHNIAEGKNCVTQAGKDHIILGIGGIYTGKEAEKQGIKYITVGSGRESIMMAIMSAKQVLKIKREESEKREADMIQMEKYKAILNLSTDAIMAIDNDLRVNVFNPASEKLIGLPSKEVLGKRINEVLLQNNLTRVLHTGEEELNQIVHLNNKVIYTNRVPIIIDGSVKGVVATFQDVRRIQENEHQIRVKLNEKGLVAKYHFADIKGSSDKIKNVISIAKSYAKTSSSVLITGETGTGKELFAQSIHNFSERRTFPFVAVNCSALPESLLESELFGYEGGTFTGAFKGGKVGLFELAHRGTIFLDEIAEIPENVQVQLLRVLQEKEIRRLGSDRVLPVDVRIITATNKDLEVEVEHGRFREDLFYRINVLRLSLPPLRERKQDIFEIGADILANLDNHCYHQNSNLWRDILNRLSDNQWHGNIRELHNVLERMMVILKVNDFQADIIKEFFDNLHLRPNHQNNHKRKKNERERIERVLVKNNWNRDKAAKELGISRTTLWRKMKELNLES